MREMASSAALCVLLASLSGQAIADVRVDLPPKARVLGTIQPEGEVEDFFFNATRGTLLTVTVTAVRRSSLDPGLTLTGPGGAVVLDRAAHFVDQGRRVVVSRLELDATGTYALQLQGAGTGQYTLVFTATPRRLWKWAALDVGAESSEELDFAAPRGSRITFVARRVRGSAAEPRFGDFSVGDRSLLDLGRFRPASHVVRRIPADDGGEVSVLLNNLATSGGDVRATITVAALRSRRRRIDVRGFRLGAPDGGETATIRTVAAETGGTAAVDDESELDGTEVVIPPGALGRDTPILITSAPEPRPPSDDRQAAGPAVNLGPPGTKFSTPAEVTLRYYPAALPLGADVMDDVKVLRVSGRRRTLLDVIDMDPVEHTLTVETDGFSTFMPIVPKGRPNLAGRDYWNFLLEYEFDKGFGPRDPMCSFGFPYDDSRVRRAFLGYGEASFQDGSADFSLDERILDLDHHSYPPGEAVERMCFDLPGLDRDLSEVARLQGQRSTRESSEDGPATWSYEPDGRTVTTTFGVEDGLSYTVAEDGTVLAASSWEENASNVFLGLDLLIEKAQPPPTAGSVPGSYFVAELTLGARETGGGVLQLFFERGLGTIDLSPGGTYTRATDFAVVETNSAGPPLPAPPARDSENGNGTWTVTPAGLLLLSFDDGGDAVTYRMYPGLDGDLWVGVHDSFDDDDLLLVFMVRRPRNVTPAKLLGDWTLHGLEASVGQYDVMYYADFPDEPTRERQTIGLTAPDWSASAFRANEVFRARRRGDILVGTGLQVIQTVPGEAGGLDVGALTDGSARFSWTVTSGGALRIIDDGDVFDGFVTPNLMFSITMDRVKVARASQLLRFFGLDLRVRPPPAD